MSMIETVSDENNSFLSRREIICDFNRLGGKLKKLEAVEMITRTQIGWKNCDSN